MRKAEEEGKTWAGGVGAQLALLSAPRKSNRAPDRPPRHVIAFAPNPRADAVTAYLRDVATSIHGYFSAGSKNAELRVIRPISALTQRA
jgi:hypothetical protein